MTDLSKYILLVAIMAKPSDIGNGDKSNQDAMANNDALIKQLQQELKAAQEAAKKNGK